LDSAKLLVDESNFTRIDFTKNNWISSSKGSLSQFSF